MSSQLARLISYLSGVLLLVHSAAPQSPSAANGQSLQIRGASGHPSYFLHVWAKGAHGYVDVRDESKHSLQTLRCRLLRDNAAASNLELQAASEIFVSHFQVADFNFDGYPDFIAPREFGAKWAKYCVWLFDPDTGKFVSGFLSTQLEQLSNLSVDPELRQVISFSMGPTSPVWEEYRIDYTQKDRPQLKPVQSCRLETVSAGAEPEPPYNYTAIVVTRYERGRPITERHPLAAAEKRGLQTLCNAFPAL